MAAVASLQGAENLTVEPGQTTSCEMSLANTGSIVEQFTILIVGDAAPWTQVDPPVVSLFPGAQQTVTITFSPPRSHETLAGLVPFGVKVIPSNEPDESVTEEGSITVGSFNDLGAELVPRLVTGRLAGRQRLAVDSRGNTAIPVVVTALDGADALKFQIRPERFSAAPGAAHFVRIRIVPRKRHWKGPVQQKPYRVTVEGEGERPLTLEGGLNQHAVIPKWVYAVVVLAAILVALWFLLIKPAVHSTAVNANKAALAAQAQKTNAAAAQAAGANSAASAANSAAAKNSAAIAALAGKKPAPTTTTSTTTTTTVPKSTATTLPPPVTMPTDGRLQVAVAPGETGTSSTGPVAKGSTLTVSDLVIQNVTGSSGTAFVERVIPGQAPQDLLVEDLGTLTDQEFTFDTPIIFSHDQQLQLQVDCNGNQTACNVGMYYTGPLTEPQSATTTTIP